MGAWIETCFNLSSRTAKASHPTWVRGLKLNGKQITKDRVLSHPTWVRGLNLKIKEQKRLVSLHHQGCYTYDVYQHVYLQIYEG